MRYLEGLPKSASYPRVGVVLVGLFGMGVLAASFGWLGLAIYFVALIALFH